jgi:23S rRNA pseudouridine1911/1915/1917 synthase
METRTLQVIYEDNHLIAVNKPRGVLVQGDETEDTPLSDMVKEYIRIRYNKPGEAFLGVIHRLDRPVSGVVVFARTSKALARMNELFKIRKIEKRYWAVTRERPDPEVGHLLHYIIKDAEKNISKALDQPSNRNKDAKLSELDYEMIAEMDGMHLLLVKPETGRPHQIRVQLARIGCPILGDLKYGSKEKFSHGGIYLHCRSLSFLHPVKQTEVKIVADTPPDHLWNQLRSVGEAAERPEDP